MADPLLWAQRRWWTLQRFGCSPGKLPRRLANGRAPRVFCTTFPKAGTHLLERALCLHPRLYRAFVPTLNEENVYERGGLRRLVPALRPGQVLLSHLPYERHFHGVLRRNDMRPIFLIRDPRDIVVSDAHFIASWPAHPHHDRFAAEPDLAARIRLAISGIDGRTLTVGDSLGRFLPWLDAGALVLRFEDLVGAPGGGDARLQRQTLDALYAHLGVALPPTATDRIQERLFSRRSPTFRRGTIGGWRDTFDDRAKDSFKAVANDVLVRLGYEADDRW